MRFSRLLIIFALLNLSLNAQEAKDQSLDSSKVLNNSEEKPSAWPTEKDNMLSPFTTPAKWILLSGAVLTYAVYRDTKNKGDFGYTEDHAERTDGDWRYWGNIMGWGAFQAIYTLTQLPGINRRDQRALENTEMMWKSTIYTSLSTLALKLTVTEQRRNGEHKFESFPSGHASAAFAFATNVAIRHEWYWNFITFPLAYWVTAARVEDDSHYIHDSIFGAALGASFAVGMNYISKDTPFLLGFVPVEDGGGLTFKYSF